MLAIIESAGTAAEYWGCKRLNGPVQGCDLLCPLGVNDRPYCVYSLDAY
jgi:hypothetical protein